MRHGRRWVSLWVGGAVLAALLFVLVPAASSSDGDVYGTTTSPEIRVAGASGTDSTFDVKITNDSSNGHTIGAIQVTVNSAFGNVAAASATGWNVNFSGHVVTLRNDNGLAVGGSVTVTIQADTPKQATFYAWETAADSDSTFVFGTGTPDFTSEGDPEIQAVHGPLDHFNFDAFASPQTAGAGFSVSATAVDQYQNPLGGDYTGSPSLSGTLLGSPRGCSGPCTASYGNPPSVSNGVASWSGVVGYGAQTGATLTATDGVSGTSDPFDVQPASLDHFTLDAVGDQVAGAGFTVKATAEDKFDNPLGSNYTGTPVLSGTLLDSGRGCPDASTACSATYGNPPSVSDGVATWTGVTGYGAQTGATVTASDGGPSGTSDPFNVEHAGLDHFTFDSVSTPQTAGLGFTVKATAEDKFENPLGGDYSGTPSLSGTLLGSPRGCSGPCTASYGNPPSVSNGAATWSGVIGYGAQTGATVTASDGGASGASNPFEVKHAGLDHFTLDAVGDQVAGAGFTVKATAEDKFENPLGGDYSGTPSLSGTLLGSPRGCTGPCTPSYGNPPSMSNGVATWTGVTGYGAQTGATVTATDGVSGTSDPFNVKHAGLDHFTLDAVSTPQIAGAGFTVKATAEDKFENPLGGDYTGTPSLSGTLLGSPRGCSGPCTASYGTVSVSGGVATWSGVTGYGAQTGATVTAMDGAASGSSNPFNVKHASLDHFTLDAVSTPQIAGAGFTVKATAEDKFENPLGSDYSGTPSLSGTLLGSARGCPGPGSPCTVSYPNPPSTSNGVATWSGVKGYGAQTGATVTATDGSVSGTSNSFDVKHASLDHFTLDPVGGQIAGAGFTVKATSEDKFENPLGNDYSGGATLSGTLTQSSRGCGTGNTSPCSATYGNPASWSNGIGTWTVTAYNAEGGRTVTAKDGSITGTSNTFAVQPADPALLTFTQQPNDTQPNPPACSGSAVCTIQTKVQDLDFYGNPEVGVPVNVQIDSANNPGSDTLTGLTTGECTGGVCTKNADNNGVATFSDLTLHNVAVAYKLKATSGPTVSPPGPPTASTLSAFFNVAQTVTKCNGNCSASATDTFDNITATVTGVGGNLSVALENKTVTNGTQCVIKNEVGNLVTVNPTAPATGATLEVTGTLLHRSNKGGVGNIIFCKNSGPTTQFHTVGLCSQTKPKNTPPCLAKLSGNGQGDVFFDLISKAIPDPNNPGSFVFDPSMGGGGG